MTSNQTELFAQYWIINVKKYEINILINVAILLCYITFLRIIVMINNRVTNTVLSAWARYIVLNILLHIAQVHCYYNDNMTNSATI